MLASQMAKFFRPNRSAVSVPSLHNCLILLAETFSRAAASSVVMRLLLMPVVLPDAANGVKSNQSGDVNSLGSTPNAPATATIVR